MPPTPQQARNAMSSMEGMAAMKSGEAGHQVGEVLPDGSVVTQVDSIGRIIGRKASPQETPPPGGGFQRGQVLPDGRTVTHVDSQGRILSMAQPGQRVLSSSDPEVQARVASKETIPSQQAAQGAFEAGMLSETGSGISRLPGTNVFVKETSPGVFVPLPGAPAHELPEDLRQSGLARGAIEEIRRTNPVLARFLDDALGGIGALDPGRVDPQIQQLLNIGAITQEQAAAAQDRAAQSRAQTQEAIGLLRGIATGQESPISIRARLASEDLARQAAAQQASQRGGFNPAAQRAALLGLSEAQGRLAAETAAAEAEAQQAAINQLIEATGGVTERDIQQQLAAGTVGTQLGALQEVAANLGLKSEEEQRAFIDLILAQQDKSAAEALQSLGLAVQAEG